MKNKFKKIFAWIFSVFVFLFGTNVFSFGEDWDDDGIDDDHLTITGHDYDYDNYITMGDGNGGTIDLSYDDIYDEDGNLIFSCDDPDAMDRITDFFEDQYNSRNGISSNENDPDRLASKLHEALVALEKAEKSGKKEEIEKAQKTMEQAQKDLDNFCKRTGYEVKISGQNVAIYDLAKKPVGLAGDPVILATGQFVINDQDCGLSYGGCSFSVTRNFKTFPQRNHVMEKPGYFGKGWFSSLEARIVRGQADYASSELYDAALEYQKLLEESVSELTDIVSEDSSCQGILDYACNRLSENQSYIENLERVLAMKDSVVEFNRYTAYGAAGELCKNFPVDEFIFCDIDGTLFYLVNKGDSLYVPKDPALEKYMQMEVFEDGYCVEINDFHLQMYFDEYGLPVKYCFSDGNTLCFEYENHRLKELVLNEVKKICFTWENELISKITVGKNEFKYFYQNGFLTSLVDFEGDSRGFEYDEDGYISKQIKADGSFVSFKYKTVDESGLEDEYSNSESAEKMSESDSEIENIISRSSEEESSEADDYKIRTYKVTEQTIDENGVPEFFAYFPEEKRTVFTNKDGQETVYFYDEFNRTLQEKMEGVYLRKWTYNENNQLSAYEDNGESAQYIYEEDLLKEIKYSDGTSEKFIYQGNTLCGKENRNGESFVYDLDECFRIRAVFVNNEFLYRVSFNQKGLRESYQDCRNNRSEYEYDFRGNLIMEKWFTGSVNAGFASYKYDDDDRLIEYNDSDGKKIEISYENHKTTYLYSTGLKIEKYFSCRKLLEKEVSTDMNSGEAQVKNYTYDKTGKCISVFTYSIDENGVIQDKGALEEFSFTKNGNILSHNNCYEYIASTGERISEICDSFFYDDSGSLMQIERKNNTAQSGSLQKIMKPTLEEKASSAEKPNHKNTSISEALTFFPDGLIKQAVSPAGIKTDFFYDVKGNLISCDNGIKKTTYSYYLDGTLSKKEVFDKNNVLLYQEEWKKTGKKGEVFHIVGGKQVEKWLKNAFGMLISSQKAVENPVYYKNDLFGRCIEKKDENGNVTKYQWGIGNFLEKITFSNGGFKTFKYDADFNCIEECDENGIIKQMSYNDSGRVVKRRMRPSGIEICSLFDPEKNSFEEVQNGKVLFKDIYDDSKGLKTRVDGFGNASLFYLNQDGNLYKQINRLGFQEEYVYDEGGLVLEKTDFNGAKTLYEYEKDLTGSKALFSDGNYIFTKYDAYGNLIHCENNTASYEYGYDLGGRIIYQKDKNSGNKISYSYDEWGRLRKIEGLGKNLSYEYGKNGKIQKITHYGTAGADTAGGRSISFEYDLSGREKARIYEENTVIKSFYDSSDRLILRSASSDEYGLMFVEGWIYDEWGRKVLSIDSQLNYTRYEYDSHGRICAVYSPYSAEKEDYYRSLLRDCGIFSLDKETVFERDSLNRMEIEKIEELCSLSGRTMSFIPGIRQMIKEEFFYDKNSNLIKRSNPWGEICFSYNNEDQLIEFGQGCSCEYDKNGNLLKLVTPVENITLTYNSLNKVCKSSIYDLQNNKREEYSFTYDAFGRLSQTVYPDGKLSECVYEGLSSRLYLEKTYSRQDNALSEYDKVRTLDNDFWKQNSEKELINFDSENYEKHKAESSISDGQSYFSPVYDFSGRIAAYQDDKFLAGSDYTFCFTSESGSLKGLLRDLFPPEIIDYDILGGVIRGKSIFAFNGQRIMPDSRMYNYGNRNYIAFAGCFAQRDPVLDGSNWYSYCAGDPLNYIDSDGYSITVVEEQYMQDMGEVLLGNSDYVEGKDSDGKIIDKSDYADKQGCLVTAMAEILTAVMGLPVTPAYVNSIPSNFQEESSLLSWAGIKENYGISDFQFRTYGELLSASNSLKSQPDYPFYVNQNYFVLQEMKKDLVEAFDKNTPLKGEKSDPYFSSKTSEVKNFLDSVSKSKEDFVVLAQVIYDVSHPNSGHFVSVAGNVVNVDGKSYLPVVPTSKSDRTVNQVRTDAGWIKDTKTGRILVPLDKLMRLDMVQKNK